MKHTILSPRDAAWLAGTFDRNRALFAGWSMKGDDDGAGDGTDGDKPKDDEPKGDSKPDDEPKGDEPLGQPGKKALEAEREARKKLETEIAGLKKGLLALGGGDPDGQSDDAADAVTKIQQRLDEMQHENAVLALANEHKITDKDDLALLRGTRDSEALKLLAARLAPKEGDNKGSKKPKPDGSQGGGDASDTKASVARGREMFAASRGKKSD